MGFFDVDLGNSSGSSMLASRPASAGKVRTKLIDALLPDSEWTTAAGTKTSQHQGPCAPQAYIRSFLPRRAIASSASHSP